MFVIEVPYINLNQIYNSGQVFRWIKLRDSKYVIPFGNQALKVEQQKQRLIMSCTDEQFYLTWYHYFDLRTDYCKLNFKMKRINDFMKVCANRSSGVRIVQQDLFESIITGIVYQDNSFYDTKCILDTIASVCGVEHRQAMREAGRITWYEFPTPEKILENLSALKKLHIHTDMIEDVCNDIVDGWLDLLGLHDMSYEDAFSTLCDFITPEAAEYVCLCGLHHMQSVSKESMIDEALAREENLDWETFSEWHLDGAINEKGFVAQCIIHNAINPPKKEVHY